MRQVEGLKSTAWLKEIRETGKSADWRHISRAASFREATSPNLQRYYPIFYYYYYIVYTPPPAFTVGLNNNNLRKESARVMHSGYLRIAHFPIRKAIPLCHLLKKIYLYEALSSRVAVICREALYLSAGFSGKFSLRKIRWLRKPSFIRWLSVRSF